MPSFFDMSCVFLSFWGVSLILFLYMSIAPVGWSTHISIVSCDTLTTKVFWFWWGWGVYHSCHWAKRQSLQVGHYIRMHNRIHTCRHVSRLWQVSEFPEGNPCRLEQYGYLKIWELTKNLPALRRTGQTMIFTTKKTLFLSWFNKMPTLYLTNNLHTY